MCLQTAETWLLKDVNKRKLRALEMKCKRRILRHETKEKKKHRSIDCQEKKTKVV